MIDFGCPKCGTTQRVPDSAAGHKLPCVKCGQRLQVPETAEMRTMQGVLSRPKLGGLQGGKQWFCEQDGKPSGALTWAELKRMAAEGELSPDDRVWTEGMTGWKAATTIPNLFPKAPAKRSATSDGATGQWMEGLGVLFFGGLAGLALLLFAGYFVWRAVKRTETPSTPEAALVSSSEKGQPKEQPDRPLEPREIFERCSASVAQVLNKGGSGSGFLARPGIVVTNFHVVADDFAGHIQVTFPSAPGGNNPLKGTLLYEDRTRDLAILRVESPLKPLPLADREFSPGERVVVIGSPGALPGQTVKNAPTDGIISARTQLNDNQDWYQFTAQINPGNSGGPIFNSRGQVLGVVTLFLRGKQGMNYAVPYGEVSKALDRALSKSQQEQEQLAAEHDVVVAFRKVGKTSCLYLYAMNVYCKAMDAAIKKGREPGEGLKAASARIDKSIAIGASRFLDAECRSILPRVVGNRVLPEATRQQMENLIALCSEMKDWFDNPRGSVKQYNEKTGECANKLTRLFESLRLRLGVNEDPRLTRVELQDLELD